MRACLDRPSVVRHGRPLAPAATLPATRSPQYLSFEPELGGWNNLRSAFESFVVLAAITGRTLVLPPKSLTRDRLPAPFSPGFHTFKSFADFLTLDKLAAHLRIISTEAFFAAEVDRPSGRLAHRPPPQSVRGPAVPNPHKHALYVYLRRHGVEPDWRPAAHCLLIGPPQRHDEAFCDGRMPVRYNATLQNAWLLHFPLKFSCSSRQPKCNPDLHWVKWSTAQWYSWIRVTEAAADRRYKRLIRDALQYVSPIVCAAGAIVLLLRQEARGHGAGRCQQLLRDLDWGSFDAPDDGFSALHLRSGDMATFRPQTAVNVETVAHAMAPHLRAGELLYVATDANLSALHHPLQARGWRLRSLKDFRCILTNTPGLSPDMHGMVEQVVAAHGRTFHGTLYSTFSGYILRLRGYRATASGPLAAWRLPLVGESASTAYSRLWPSQPDFWRREWPLAWEGLDRDDDMEMAEPKHDEHEASLSATRLRQATACLRRCLGFAVNTNACIESEGRFYHYAHALDGALTEAGAKTLSSCDRKKRPARRP